MKVVAGEAAEKAFSMAATILALAALVYGVAVCIDCESTRDTARLIVEAVGAYSR